MRRGSLTAMSGLAAMLLAAGTAWGENDVKKKGAAPSPPAMSLEEAIKVAKTKFPGRVLEAEVEEEDGKLVYEVEIQGADGETREIEIEATSGRVSVEESEDSGME